MTIKEFNGYIYLYIYLGSISLGSISLLINNNEINVLLTFMDYLQNYYSFLVVK